MRQYGEWQPGGMIFNMSDKADRVTCDEDDRYKHFIDQMLCKRKEMNIELEKRVEENISNHDVSTFYTRERVFRSAA